MGTRNVETGCNCDPDEDKCPECLVIWAAVKTPHLGVRLVKWRKARRLTQGELARLSGIGVKTISSFETGDRADSMRIDQLSKLCAALAVSPSHFLADDDSASTFGWREFAGCG